jgi:hypothetical protein
LPKPSMRLKAWKGPLPSRRITPPAVLPDFIVSSTIGARGDPPVVEEWVEQRRPGAPTRAAARSSPVQVVGAAMIKPRFEVLKAGSAEHEDGPQARWVGFGRALMGLQRATRRYPSSTPGRSHAITPSTPPPLYHVSNVASDHRHQPPYHVPAPPFLSVPPRETPRRSFAQVVAGDRAVVVMSGPSRPPCAARGNSGSAEDGCVCAGHGAAGGGSSLQQRALSGSPRFPRVDGLGWW